MACSRAAQRAPSRFHAEGETDAPSHQANSDETSGTAQERKRALARRGRAEDMRNPPKTRRFERPSRAKTSGAPRLFQRQAQSPPQAR